MNPKTGIVVCRIVALTIGVAGSVVMAVLIAHCGGSTYEVIFGAFEIWVIAAAL